MAKPTSKPTAKSGVAAKHKSQLPKSKGGKPAPNAQQQPHKHKSGKPTPGQQHHKTKPFSSDKPNAHATATPAALQLLVTKMEDPTLQWYEAVKPLKEVPPTAAVAAVVVAPGVGAKGNSRKKNKKLQELALERAAKGLATPANPLDADASKLPEAEIDVKKRRAQQLLEAEVQRVELKRSTKMSSDDKYLATMMKNGTLADRVAALTLTIQASPFHCLARLSQLITMASKKARRESMMAVDSLKDLFINNLLPDDRRLRFFHQNPLAHADATDAHFVLWFYEHCLKTAFAQLVGVLANGMEDAVDNHKRACIRAASALLAAKPEQEAVLLAMLVNKLGDPDRKIASYIHKTLAELLTEHPAMKRVVIDEVERVLTRPQVSERTKYNAILFMNQLYLDKRSSDDATLAAHLISVYFGLFTKEVHGSDALNGNKSNAKTAGGNKKHKKKKHGPLAADGMDRKLLSALLVGVNRAFPYATTTTAAQFADEIDALFTVVHRAHFSTSVQALMLLFQVMQSTHAVSDRFYTALYAKLLDPKVRETSKHTLFLNVVFRAMKTDVSPARTAALMKRLLQLTTVMTPAFTCAVLFLLSELLKVKPALRTLLDQPEATGGSSSSDANNNEGDGNDDGDEHFADADDGGESDKDDDEGESDDEEEEHDKENDDDAARASKVVGELFGDAPATTKAPTPGARHDDTTASTTAPTCYDPHKRNPLYAGAELSCAWELHQLVHHYHPSVQMFARQLLLASGGGGNAPTGITYAGDPLVDFTMLAFFEKFMNKKPRHKVASGSGNDGAATKSWNYVPINSEAVLDAAGGEASIDATDRFFYKFFKDRAAREHAVPALAKKKQQKRKSVADGTSRDADAFSDLDGSDEDDELEAFAQELAEGIMKDGDLDDEDPDIDNWSDSDDDGEEDGGELDGELSEGGDDDDDEAMGDAFNAASDNDSDDDGDDLEMDAGDSDSDDDGGDDSDDSDDADGFDFAHMDGDMDDDDADAVANALAADASAKKKTPPAPKRKSPFASADDYEVMVQQALEKQAAAGRKKSKRS